ncbi:hypothetical protein DO97_10020 [Neosynechococcus sphagnicola sy1]|uniref:Uncharacterized protein n=1 Tax=Neosynechococcus sphagnicola sy1 TaxID=1497020 RepID=A0A098TNC0_9CYAN|nr:hypothetical protein [Neosynechococcus sphagnicola]KGF73756.1 hypothetical protein DO97_10020 [Neosynechococcus sphagnicola sy1]
MSPEPSQQPEPEPTPRVSVLSKVQQLWHQAQPRLRTKTIQLLRTAIQALEAVAEKLEVEPAPPVLPPAASKMMPSEIASEVALDHPP